MLSGGVAPDLIYLPERTFDKEVFLDSVRAALLKHPSVLVCVSEGIRYADGSYVGASGASKDAFGHVRLSGAAKVLEWLVKDSIGCKVRSIELNLPQRAAAHLLSATDINESVRIGMGAVEAAVAGESGVMMTFVREKGSEYSCRVESAEISSIANAVRQVPSEFINETSDGITEAGLEYLLPLIQGEVDVVYENGMPKHAVI